MRATVRGLLLAAGAGLVLAASPARAQAVSCAITATPMAFGVYDAAMPATLGPVTSTITVTCSVPPGAGNVPGVSLDLSLSPGSSGSYGPRLMTGVQTGDKVKYNVFTTANSSGATIWGDGTAGTATVSVTLPRVTPGRSARADLRAYGYVLLDSDVAADDYSDTIMVIANW